MGEKYMNKKKWIMGLSCLTASVLMSGCQNKNEINFIKAEVSSYFVNGFSYEIKVSGFEDYQNFKFRDEKGARMKSSELIVGDELFIYYKNSYFEEIDYAKVIKAKIIECVLEQRYNRETDKYIMNVVPIDKNSYISSAYFGDILFEDYTWKMMRDCEVGMKVYCAYQDSQTTIKGDGTTYYRPLATYGFMPR